MFGEHTIVYLASKNVLSCTLMVFCLKKKYRNSEKEKNIFNHILNNPGCITSDIIKMNNLNKGTVRYYIQQLENKNKIILIRFGKYAHLFSRSILFSDIEKFLLTFTRNETNKTILAYILEYPEITIHELSEKFDLDKSNIHRRMKILLKKGIIEHKNENRINRYFIKDEYLISVQKIIK